MLHKFGLLRSCQPITGQLIDKTGSNFTHLSVTIAISPKWFDKPVFLPVSSEKVQSRLSVTSTIIPKWFDYLFFTCLSVRKPWPPSRSGLSGWPNRASTQWYPMVPNGTTWFSMMLNGTRWFQMVTNGTKWYQMVPNGTKWYLMVTNRYQWYHTSDVFVPIDWATLANQNISTTWKLTHLVVPRTCC